MLITDGWSAAHALSAGHQLVVVFKHYTLWVPRPRRVRTHAIWRNDWGALMKWFFRRIRNEAHHKSVINTLFRDQQSANQWKHKNLVSRIFTAIQWKIMQIKFVQCQNVEPSSFQHNIPVWVKADEKVFFLIENKCKCQLKPEYDPFMIHSNIFKASLLNTDKCSSSALNASLAAGVAAAFCWFYGDTRYQHRAGVAPPARPRRRHRIDGGICRWGN